MAKPLAEFTYTRETLSEMSGWPVNRIYQDECRGVLDPSNIASVAIWLAANGTDIIRAAMAAQLLPPIFGASSGTKAAVDPMCKSEFLRVIYAADNKSRQKLARRKKPAA